MSDAASPPLFSRNVLVHRLNRVHPVLVLEDSDEDFDTVLVATRLAGIQHEIRRVMSGDDLLLMLQGESNRLQTQAALVLLDLNTPQGDGRHALELLHTHAQLSAVPLVVVSTSANPRDVDFCYAHGANAYHVKPVNHAEHLLVLQKLFAYWLSSVVLPTEHALER